MTQTDPTTLGELWRAIERDSNLTREQVKRELDDVKKRLDSYVTKDHFEAEKRLLEARIEHAEQALAALERQDNSRRQSYREFVYKGIIPALALVIAAISIIVSSK